MLTQATLWQVQEVLLTIQIQVLSVEEPWAVSEMARQARSPPAVAGSHTTRIRIRESPLGTTMCTRPGTAASIATTSRRVCNRGRVPVGNQFNVQPIGVGYRINRKRGAWVKCGRGEIYKTEEVVLDEDRFEPRMNTDPCSSVAKLIYRSSRTERMFPAGSLNHAIIGPCGPRAMPRSSVLISGMS